MLEKEPAPLTALSPHHPKGLERIVNRLLAKRAGDRYQSAQELTPALEGLATAGRHRPLSCKQ